MINVNWNCFMISPSGSLRRRTAFTSKLLPACAAIAAMAPFTLAQDVCSTASAVFGSGIYFYASTGFSVAGPINTCRGSADPFDFWYLYTATATGVATISNCPASIMAPGGAPIVGLNTAIAVWNSSACPPTAKIVCGDGAPGCPGAIESEVVFPVIAGQSYYVQITNGPSSNLPISGFIAIVEMPPIPGDDCLSALSGVLGANPSSNIGATTTAGVGSACTFGTASNEIWYTFVPMCVGDMGVTTCGPTGTLPDTFIAVYDACPTQGGVEIACNDNNNAGTSCVGTLRSAVMVPVMAGNMYYIAVGGRNGGQGTFDLTIRCRISHQWSQPTGAGSLRLEVVSGTPGAFVFSPIMLDILAPPGSAFPNGWFYGLDIPIADLFSELSFPPPSPFTSTLNNAGYSLNLDLPAGSVSFLIGVTLWSVGVEFNPATFVVTGWTTPTAFLITT